MKLPLTGYVDLDKQIATMLKSHAEHAQKRCIVCNTHVHPSVEGLRQFPNLIMHDACINTLYSYFYTRALDGYTIVPSTLQYAVPYAIYLEDMMQGGKDLQFLIVKKLTDYLVNSEIYITQTYNEDARITQHENVAQSQLITRLQCSFTPKCIFCGNYLVERAPMVVRHSVSDTFSMADHIPQSLQETKLYSGNDYKYIGHKTCIETFLEDPEFKARAIAEAL